MFKRLLSVFSKRIWRRIIAGFLLCLAPIFLFVELADEVREQSTHHIDQQVLLAINQFATPMLDAVTVGLTQLGGVVGVVVITAGIAAILWGRGRRRKAVQLAVGVGGATVLMLLLKTVFQRDRPALWERLVVENSYSFPSGHAMASSALAFSLVMIFWQSRWRWWVVAGAGIYMFTIALTRLYLGVHYPTDILAGWLVSLAWVGIVFFAVNYSGWKLHPVNVTR